MFVCKKLTTWALVWGQNQTMCAFCSSPSVWVSSWAGWEHSAPLLWSGPWSWGWCGSVFPPTRLWLQSVAARWLLRGAAAALRGVRIDARVGHLLLYKWLWKYKPKQSDSASPTAKPPAVSNERCPPVTDLSSLTQSRIRFELRSLGID